MALTAFTTGTNANTVPHNYPDYIPRTDSGYIARNGTAMYPPLSQSMQPPTMYPPLSQSMQPPTMYPPLSQSMQPPTVYPPQPPSMYPPPSQLMQPPTVYPQQPQTIYNSKSGLPLQQQSDWYPSAVPPPAGMPPSNFMPGSEMQFAGYDPASPPIVPVPPMEPWLPESRKITPFATELLNFQARANADRLAYRAWAIAQGALPEDKPQIGSSEGVYHIALDPNHSCGSVYTKATGEFGSVVGTEAGHLVVTRTRVLSVSQLVDFVERTAEHQQLREHCSRSVGWRDKWPPEFGMIPGSELDCELETSTCVVIVEPKTVIPDALQSHPSITVLRSDDGGKYIHWLSAMMAYHTAQVELPPSIAPVVTAKLDSEGKFGLGLRSKHDPALTVTEPIFESVGSFMFVVIGQERYPCGWPDLKNIAMGRGASIAGPGGTPKLVLQDTHAENEHPVAALDREEEEEIGWCSRAAGGTVEFSPESIQLMEQLGIDVGWLCDPECPSLQRNLIPILGYD